MNIQTYFRDVPGRVRRDFESRGPAAVLRLGPKAVDTLVEEFTQRYQLPTNRIMGDPGFDWVDPELPSRGVTVSIPLERGGAAALEMMELEPSRMTMIGAAEPSALPTAQGLTFTAMRRSLADQSLNALTTNINQRNEEIERGNESLSQLIRPVVEELVARVREREIGAVEEWEGVLSTRPPDGAAAAETYATDTVPSVDLPLVEQGLPGGSIDGVLTDLRALSDGDSRGTDFLSRSSALIAQDDPTTFRIVVTDVQRRMWSIVDDPTYDPRVRAYAGAAASSLDVVLGEFTGEFSPSEGAHATVSFENLSAELAALALQLASPKVAVVAQACLILIRYLRRRTV